MKRCACCSDPVGLLDRWCSTRCYREDECPGDDFFDEESGRVDDDREIESTLEEEAA